jgi:hypothetical protein
MRTIPFDAIDPNPVSSLIAFRAGPEVSIRRLRLRAGLSFASVPPIEQGLVKASAGATRMVNQWNEPSRGFGASLVYYTMSPSATAVPGWFGEASVDITERVAAFGGVGADNVRLLVETGYDRFDQFEVYRRDVAGVIRIRGAHGGVLLRAPFAPGHSVGVRLAAGRLGQPLGAGDMTVGTSGRWYASVGISVQHVFVRLGQD